ncbi:MAG: EpsG family protein [Firmicutes bacterium]|nr:EpsG family protein [Candidatus Colimorpha enterica]
MMYYSVFAWVFLLAFLSNYVTMTHEIETDGAKAMRWKTLYAVIAFAPVIIIAALTVPRGDTYTYLTLYDRLPDTLGDLIASIDVTESGFGFTVLSWIIKKCVFGSVYGYRLVIALIQSIPIIFIFKNYSEDYLTSLFLFLASGVHIAWMMNGLRQYIAVTIIFAATPLLLKNKYIPYLLCVLFASTIHITAIIMIPIVFVCLGEKWNRRILLFLLAALILTVVFARRAELLEKWLEHTEYSGAVESAKELGDDGTNPVRVLVSAVPMIMALFVGDRLKDDGDGIVTLAVNMSVVTFGLYLISMVTSGIIIGRLPIYTMLYSFILLPHLIRKCFSEDSVKIINFAMIGLYMLYYLYEYRAY